MTLIQQFVEWITGRTKESTVETVPTPAPEIPVDKVGTFNFQAPQVFAPRLNELGYHIHSFYASPDKGFLSSSCHNYFNKDLKLIISLEQAPYYTDYGFSIFLHNTENQEKILLCNVPHEQQDTDSKFLNKICSDLFASTEILALIKGVEWRKVKPLGLEQ